MNHKEYLDKLDLDQLRFVVEHAQERITSLLERSKTTYWQVSDYWINHGYFVESDYEAAVDFFTKIARKRGGLLEELIIKKVKLYPEDAEGLLK